MNREHALRVYNFQEIQRVVPLAAVLERYGILHALKKIGKQHFGLCPIHGGSKNRKAFVCDLEKNVWRCFGDCDRGGSTLEFVSEMEGRIPVFRAAALVAEWFAVRTEQSGTTQRRKPMSENSHRRPTHKVFTVRGEGENAWWTRLGSAWPTKDSRGLNIVLDGLPIDGRLVLREYSDEDHKREEEAKQKSKQRR